MRPMYRFIFYQDITDSKWRWRLMRTGGALMAQGGDGHIKRDAMIKLVQEMFGKTFPQAIEKALSVLELADTMCKQGGRRHVTLRDFIDASSESARLAWRAQPISNKLRDDYDGPVAQQVEQGGL